MTQKSLQELFQKTADHKITHACGGHPYEYGSVLTALIAATGAQSILEVGTALGYSTICLAEGNPHALIDTIDQDAEHLDMAQKNWQDFQIDKQITAFPDKAEAVLRTLKKSYDFIFFDAYAPQIFMLDHFERLLQKNGVLVTANLYLKDPNGGKYVRRLKNEMKTPFVALWSTGFFADTAISVKLTE